MKSKEKSDKFYILDLSYCFNKKCNGCKRSRECESYENRIQREMYNRNNKLIKETGRIIK